MPLRPSLQSGTTRFRFFTSAITAVPTMQMSRTISMRIPGVPKPAMRLTMDDLSYYLGRLVCSLGLHSCEDTEALLSIGHVAFWVLLGLIGVGAWRFRTK